MRENKGFSLVELIIVVAIMAVLIGVLVPQYIKYVEKSKRSKDEETARELLEVANVITADVDYYSLINAGDHIKFDRNGVTTNNDSIRDQILPEFISGWTNVKVLSKQYRDKCYTVEFVNDVHDNKLAIQVGWN